MRSEALENIVTMLRAQADERGGAPMTLGEWREAYDGLGALLPAAEGVAVEEVDAGGVRAERIGSGDGPHGARAECRDVVADHRRIRFREGLPIVAWRGASGRRRS